MPTVPVTPGGASSSRNSGNLGETTKTGGTPPPHTVAGSDPPGNPPAPFEGFDPTLGFPGEGPSPYIPPYVDKLRACREFWNNNPHACRHGASCRYSHDINLADEQRYRDISKKLTYILRTRGH